MSEPIQLGPDTSWGSYLVPLMACIVRTRGAILEVGVGHWSTPLLHRYCAAAGRKLVSADSDPVWVNQFAGLRLNSNGCIHQVLAVNYDYFLKEMSQEKWSVVFLDHSPGSRRAQDALLFRDTAEFIVVHDYSGDEVASPFQPLLEAGNWKVWEVFNGQPSTLILSHE